MNNTLHQHLNHLRLIGRIREGQRLDTTKDITVYDDTILSWVMRKWNHDGKDEGVRFLRELYSSINQSTDQLIIEMLNAKSPVKKQRKLSVVVNLAKNIKSSIVGVENLSKTYSDFPKTNAQLEGIIQDYAITTYQHLVENIPADKLPVELTEDIRYNTKLLYKGNSEHEIEIKEDLC